MSTLEDLKYHDPFKGQIVTRECTQAAANELTRLREINKELLAALGSLRKTAALLLENAHGCAVNHYGNDYQLFGPPGWLADCDEEIRTAQVAIDKATGAQ